MEGSPHSSFGKRKASEANDRSGSLLARLGSLDPPLKYLVAGVLLVAVLLWHQTHSCWLPKTTRTGSLPPHVSQAAMAFSLKRSNFLLFGDSLTERGFSLDGWVASLAHQYQRRVDVINRGLGGYNTRWALQITPDVFQDVNAQNTRLVTIFFGANDAARPDGPSVQQHVPVKEYTANLKQLVSKVRATGVKRIVLLTPPPVSDQGRKAWQIVKVGEAAAAKLSLDRTLDFTAAYAKACVAVGQELSLPVVNLFEIMQKPEGWGELYFCDGLHFTAEGNQLVHKHLMSTLEAAYPDLSPEAIPLHFPPWDSVNDTVLKELPALRKQGPYAEQPLPPVYQPTGHTVVPNSND